MACWAPQQAQQQRHSWQQQLRRRLQQLWQQWPKVLKAVWVWQGEVLQGAVAVHLQGWAALALLGTGGRLCLKHMPSGGLLLQLLLQLVAAAPHKAGVQVRSAAGLGVHVRLQLQQQQGAVRH